MGNPNSKRARRRLRARMENDPDLVYEFGRWMVRTVAPVERVDLGGGYVAELHNESWHELGSRGYGQ
jgi:hypothetical protein